MLTELVITHMAAKAMEGSLSSPTINEVNSCMRVMKPRLYLNNKVIMQSVIKLLFYYQELMTAFRYESQNTGSSRLLLTAAVPTSSNTVKGGYDIPRLAK